MVRKKNKSQEIMKSIVATKKGKVLGKKIKAKKMSGKMKKRRK